MLIINIGLENNAGGTVDVRAALAAVIGRTRAVSCGVHQSDSEPTLVIIAECLSTQSAWHIAAMLNQDCIAVYDPLTQRGRLIGPRADAWGGFTPAYFVLPDGSRLDPTARGYTAERATRDNLEAAEMLREFIATERGEG